MEAAELLSALYVQGKLDIGWKFGQSMVELRAFCLKHSDLPENKSILPQEGFIEVRNEFSEANDLPVTLLVSGEHNLRDCRNGGLVSDSNPDNLNHNANHQMEDYPIAGRGNENVDASDSLSFALVLKKCISEGFKGQMKPANASKIDSGARDGSDILPISDSGLLDPVAVKSVPPRRRTTNNIRILKDNKVICPSAGVTSENGMPVHMCRVGQSNCENPTSSNEKSISDATEMNLPKSEDIFHEVQGNDDKPRKSCLSGYVSEDKCSICFRNPSMLSYQHCHVHSASEPSDSGYIKGAVSSYIHPFINKKLLQIGVPLEDVICSSDKRNSGLVESFGASGCSNSQNQNLTCSEISKPDAVKKEQLVRSKEMELSELSPQDELEGNLFIFSIDNLFYGVAKSLPHEIDKAHQQKWDDVIVNQYLRDHTKNVAKTKP
ncbi:hypothetical protein VNO80_18928 [Phaseolus coccineus]|uniref:Uncharacterized protein n=1 Tax=Phaseolus coccineus TaxID=3886 RepID=A0AAN9QZU6_PHACN